MASENNYTDKQIGNYRVISKLASGAFGSVYLGKHAIFTKRPVVAIKLLHAYLDSQEERDWFLQEAEWLEMLQHQHILPIIDAGVHEGFPYLVTEYAPNGSLRDRIKRLSSGPLSVEECLDILSQVEQALQYAHEQNIIHRDLAPGNILFNAKSEVLLADFGIATMLDTASIKQTTNPIGTPPYMAPEQFQGEISKEIDQYALGCIAYELFTGQRPFTGNPAELMYKHINENPIPPKQLNPNVPEHMEQAILKAMAKKRSDRHADISAFVEALKSKPKSQPVNGATNRHERTSTLTPTPINSAHKSPLPPVPIPAESLNPMPQAPFTAVPLAPETKSKTSPVNAPNWSLNPGRAPIANTINVDPNMGMPGYNISAGALPSVTSNTGNPSRPVWQRFLFVTVALMLLSLLLCGGIAVAAPGTLDAFGKSVSRVFSGGPPSATVTITPKSVDVHNTYVITGVTGTPDNSKRQVQARALSATSQPESKTVSATGVVNTPGPRATGTLTFTNGSFSAYGVAANTVFTDAHGVQVANDVLAYIPAGNPNGGFGKVTVPAHAVNVGASGNMMAFDFNNVPCCGSSSVAISNMMAFTGGQDPQKYTLVQQSDVDGATNPLKSPLTQSALASLQGKKHANEQFVARPQCTTSVTSNPPVGAKATSVTVMVTAKCSAEVYAQDGVQVTAANLLKSEATKSPGPGYALAGNVVTTVTQAKVGSNGTVTLLVKAEGIWVYQFDNAEQAQLARLIAGKSSDNANVMLLQQTGVGKVDSINISGGDTLPVDATQITIVVLNVPELKEAPVRSSGSGTPTSTTSSPIPRPSPSSVPRR